MLISGVYNEWCLHSFVLVLREPYRQARFYTAYCCLLDWSEVPLYRMRLKLYIYIELKPYFYSTPFSKYHIVLEKGPIGLSLRLQVCLSWAFKTAKNDWTWQLTCLFCRAPCLSYYERLHEVALLFNVLSTYHAKLAVSLRVYLLALDVSRIRGMLVYRPLMRLLISYTVLCILQHRTICHPASRPI